MPCKRLRIDLHFGGDSENVTDRFAIASGKKIYVSLIIESNPMARTLAVIQQQIEKLQKEAENVKAKEVAGIVKRIQLEIATYGLKPNDLFEPKGRTPVSPKKVGSPKVSKAKKKSEPVIKFKDEATGKTWSGHGKRPGWYIQAIESGKTPGDLAVKPLVE